MNRREGPDRALGEHTALLFGGKGGHECYWPDGEYTVGVQPTPVKRWPRGQSGFPGGGGCGALALPRTGPRHAKMSCECFQCYSKGLSGAVGVFRWQRRPLGVAQRREHSGVGASGAVGSRVWRQGRWLHRRPPGLLRIRSDCVPRRPHRSCREPTHVDGQTLKWRRGLVRDVIDERRVWS